MVGLDQQQHFLTVDQRVIRAQRDAMFWQRNVQRRRYSLASLEQLARIFLIVFKAACQHFANPGAVQFFELRVVIVTRLAPLIISLPQVLTYAAIDSLQPLRKGFLQYRYSEERAGNLDQRQPFVVVVVLAHTRPPCANDAGTIKMTATGKVRSWGAA